VSRIGFWVALAIIVGANLALEWRLAHEDSQTNDEAAHIVAGYSYWTLHDWRLNPEHPPLSKLTAAIPLLPLSLELRPDPQKWADADEFTIGREFLYANRYPADDILVRCRAVIIVFTIALIVTIAVWARSRFGELAALIAAGLAAFDPGLLAHGHYVTSDVPVSLFFFMASIAWFSWLTSGARRWLALTGVFTGLALATKFSAFLLFPAFVVLWCVRRRRLSWRHAVYIVAVPFLIIWASYGFDTRPPASDPRIGSTLARTSGLATVPVPAYYFFRGLHLQLRHAHGGHTAYLLGRLSSHGFRWYFPIAFLVKTPLGLLAGIAVGGLILALRSPRSLWLALPALTYFAISMAGPLNIGLRHILPIYPFLYLLITAAFGHAGRIRLVLAGCVLAAAVESLAIYPLSLGFFNLVAGGPRNGTRYLLDSNVDWGQDLKRLRIFLAQRGIQQPCVAYFGEAEPAYYGIHSRPLPELRSAADVDRLNCVAVVSAQLLFGSFADPFGAIERRYPDAVVGSSLFMFDLRHQVK